MIYYARISCDIPLFLTTHLKVIHLSSAQIGEAAMHLFLDVDFFLGDIALKHGELMRSSTKISPN